MIEEFSIYIRNIAVFLIFTTFANIVITDVKYKSYINLSLGFVMIFLILSPVKYIFNNPNGDDFISVIDEFTNKISGENVIKDSEYIETSQNKLILDMYEASLSDQIKSIIDRDNNYTYIGSRIETDNTEESFGNIKSIYLTVMEKDNLEKDNPEEKKQAIKSTPKPIIRIEKVDINTSSIFSTKYKADKTKDDDTDEIKTLKKLISDFYNLSYDNIYITVQKKS